MSPSVCWQHSSNVDSFKKSVRSWNSSYFFLRIPHLDKSISNFSFYNCLQQPACYGPPLCLQLHFLLVFPLFTLLQTWASLLLHELSKHALPCGLWACSSLLPYPCLSPSIMSSLHSILYFLWNLLWPLNIKLQSTLIPDTPYLPYLLYFSLWYLSSNMIIIYFFKIMSSLPGCKSHKSKHFFFCPFYSLLYSQHM